MIFKPQLARWIPVHKPAGMSSHDVVAIARRQLWHKKIGHSGTLDPAVTGVLVLALGKATRLIQYLKGEKAYRARVRLGISTSSYDLTGEILDEQAVPALSEADLKQALASHLGTRIQIPPMVSARSVQGKRLYQWAREGVELPDRPGREITISQIELISWESPDLCFEVRCSAGTYIRSLAHDLGQQFGCGAALAQMQRTQANQFDLADCADLDSLRLLTEEPNPGVAVDYPLQHLAQIQLTETQQVLDWVHGKRLDWAEGIPTGPIRVYTPEGLLAGLAEAEEGQIKPKLGMLVPAN